MFEGLSNKFSDVFGALRKKGRITESDIDATCEELRVALLEAEIAPPEVLDQLLRSERDAIAISVKTGLGIELLKRAIEDALPHPRIEIDLLIPYNRGDLVSKIHEIGEIDDERYESDGTRIRGRVTERLAGELKNL